MTGASEEVLKLEGWLIGDNRAGILISLLQCLVDYRLLQMFRKLVHIVNAKRYILQIGNTI